MKCKYYCQYRVHVTVTFVNKSNFLVVSEFVIMNLYHIHTHMHTHIHTHTHTHKHTHTYIHILTHTRIHTHINTHTHTHIHTHTQTHTHKHTHTGPGWLMDTKGALSSPYAPTHIIMPRFSQHKRDDDSWFSEPFYSNPGGYKLCLRVDANGDGCGKGTHVSVFVYLMKGENDHQLQWPLEHNVTYGIVNWKRDKNHVIRTSHFKNAPTKCNRRVTSLDRAECGLGRAKFLPHSSLSDGAANDTQYLQNDCLCMQVLKVEPPK